MPRRLALVVGIGRYQGFSQLPTALRDAETMAHVLKEVAGFDDVLTLLDPAAGPLAEASEVLFADKETDDLLLFYFSGHGIKDERGVLHLAVPHTRKHANGELLRATAVSCRHIHEIMSGSRSRRQVVILDCCFSGAFAEGVQPKDGGHIDMRAQLGGEGRAVLTSSSSTQYSFDASETGLSTYTQYIVNGIATGEADLNHDGLITIDELHEYAKARVHSARPAMSPQILPTREGYSIVISAAPKADPGRAYAAKVREIASTTGEVSLVAAQILGLRRHQLGLSAAQAELIEETELRPRRARADARRKLRRAVYQARKRGGVTSQQSLLNELRVALDLGEAELQALFAEPLSAQQAMVLGPWFWPRRLLLAVVALAVAGAITYVALSLTQSGPAGPSSPGPSSPGQSVEHTTATDPPGERPRQPTWEPNSMPSERSPQAEPASEDSASEEPARAEPNPPATVLAKALDTAIKDLEAIRDKGGDSEGKCFALTLTAEKVSPEAKSKAETLCKEVDAARRATEAITEAKKNLDTKTNEVPFQCGIAIEDLEKLGNDWSKTKLAEVTKSCYVDLGNVILPAVVPTMRYVCDYHVDQVFKAAKKYNLKDAALDPWLKKAKAKCDTPAAAG